MSSNGSLPRQPHRRIFSFVTPSESVRLSYTAQKRNLSSTVQQHNWFQQGVLLETLEKGDAKQYSMSESDNGDSLLMMYPVFHYVDIPPNQLTNNPPLLSSTDLGSNYNLQQGVYTEIKQFRPYPEKTFPGRMNESRAFIVVGFKTLDKTFNEVLEDMWKDWTGARSIYLNLPDELGLMQLSFYRRQHPQDLNLFMYILLVQCENVTRSNTWMLLDYVQRLRVEKMMGYISAYKSAPIHSALSNGLGDLGLDEFNPNIDI